MTPYEAWHKRKPNVQHLRTFGCVAHVKRLGPHIDKLADRSVLSVFTGYEEGSKAYRIYDPVARRLFITRDVLFEEGRSWPWNELDNKHKVLNDYSGFNFWYSTDSQPLSTHSSTNTSQVVPAQPVTYPLPIPDPVPDCSAAASPATSSSSVIMPSSDSTSEPQNFRRISDIYRNSEEIVASDVNELCHVAAEEPHSVDEALQNPAWRKAMEEEMRSIEENETWESTSLPLGH